MASKIKKDLFSKERVVQSVDNAVEPVESALDDDALKEQLLQMISDTPDNTLEEKPSAATKETLDPHKFDGFIALDSSIQNLEDIDVDIVETHSYKEALKEEIDKDKSPTKREKKRTKDKRKATKRAKDDKQSTYHNNFVLADKERVIKDYQCLKVMNSKRQGVIAITNRRLLCYADEMTETELDNISGMTYKYTSGFNILRVTLFLMLASLSAFCFFISQDILLNLTQLWLSKPSWFNIVLYSLGTVSGISAMIMLIGAYSKEFKVIIYTKSSTPIVSYKGLTGNIKKDNTIRVTPGKEAKNLARELGALLLDIKDGKYQE